MQERWSTLDRIRLLALGAALAGAVVALMREPRAAQLAWQTAQVVGLTLAGALPLGTLLAALLTRTNLPGRGAIACAWTLLLFLPLYVQASAWDAGFGLQGWFTLAATRPPRALLSGVSATVWIHALAATPWVALIVSQGLRHVEAELEELALLDASPLAVFFRVTLVRALPAMVAAALFVTVTTAAEMTVTDIYRVRTYAEELYTNAALTTDAVELGLSVWPHVAILAVLTALGWQTAAMLAPIAAQAAPRQPHSFELGPWRWPLAMLVLALTLFAVGLPLGNLFYKAGLMYQNAGTVARASWSYERFSAATFGRELNPARWRFANEYRTTLLLGSCVATASTVLAAVVASLARDSRRLTRGLALLLGAGLAMPGPLVALGVIWLLNRPSPALLPWLYDETLLAPVLAIGVRTLPIASFVLWSSFRAIDQDQVDAARADGASWLSLLLAVLLPQRWPTVVAVWLVSFAIAAGDLTSSLLVIPPGRTTIANQIFILIHAGVHNAEAGLCLGQAAFFGALAAGALWLVRGTEPRD